MRDAFINTRLLDACKVVVISRYRSQKNQGAVFLRENYQLALQESISVQNVWQFNCRTCVCVCVCVCVCATSKATELKADQNFK